MDVTFERILKLGIFPVYKNPLGEPHVSQETYYISKNIWILPTWITRGVSSCRTRYQLFETRVWKIERMEHSINVLYNLIKIYINFPNVSFMNDLNDLTKETHTHTHRYFKIVTRCWTRTMIIFYFYLMLYYLWLRCKYILFKDKRGIIFLLTFTVEENEACSRLVKLRQVYLLAGHLAS